MGGLFNKQVVKKDLEPKSWIEYFGDQLQNKAAKLSTVDSLGSKKIVGIYFSAHWCPPCRGFTPVLAEFYDDCKEKGIEIEIVFISSDRDQSSFDEYYGSMPWLALPFSASDKKRLLSSHFSIEGIPCLIILGENGAVVDRDGRSTIMSCKGNVEKAIAKWSS